MGKIKSFKLQAETRVDNYKILKPLGRGWEGEVYAVEEVPTTAKLAKPRQAFGDLVKQLDALT